MIKTIVSCLVVLYLLFGLLVVLTRLLTHNWMEEELDLVSLLKDFILWPFQMRG